MTGGRLLGGSSAINGLLAIRGLPGDYDEWASLGLPGWDWASVEPYFRRLETDLDFDAEGHGRSGPMTVHRQAGALERPVMKAVAQACLRRDMPFVSDVNTDFRDGYFISPISADATGRMSTNRAYLTAEVRARPNLAIVTGASCTRLLFDGRQVSGVEAAIGDSPKRFSAPAVFLCAGAYHTPALLQRSGVGDADRLRALGMPVVADRPGVGANLRNHPFIPLGMVLEREKRRHEFGLLRRSAADVEPRCFRALRRLSLLLGPGGLARVRKPRRHHQHRAPQALFGGHGHHPLAGPGRLSVG
jgi:5-(hydroxymethyl)furfural/furfural oxidase